MKKYVVTFKGISKSEIEQIPSLMKTLGTYGATFCGQSDTTLLVEMNEENAERLRQDHPDLHVEDNLQYKML